MQIDNNPYIHTPNQPATVEQDTMQDIVDEYIVSYGQQCVYIPMSDSLVINKALNEPEQLIYDREVHRLPLIANNLQAFDNGQNVWDQFGLSFSDTATFYLSKTHWTMLGVGDRDGYDTPQVGDLVFHILSKMFFQVSEIKHRFEYLALSNATTYKLDCVIYRNTHDDFRTGDSDIDSAFQTDEIESIFLDTADNEKLDSESGNVVDHNYTSNF